MGQVSIALPIAHSDHIVIVWRLVGQAGIHGATSVYQIRCTRSGVRSRGWLVIRRRKNHERRSMSDGLKVERALTRFRVVRVSRWIYGRVPRESCSGWMLSFVAP